MTEFKAECEVCVRFKIKVSGGFNKNYRSGREVAEEEAYNKVNDMIPKGWEEIDVEVSCSDYEITGEENDNEDDD